MSAADETSMLLLQFVSKLPDRCEHWDSAVRHAFLFYSRIGKNYPVLKERGVNMNEQLDIKTFHELMNSEVASSSLLDVLRGLTEIKDPSRFTSRTGPKPLGAWSGWAF